MATYARDDIDFVAGATWDDVWKLYDEAGTLIDTALYTAELQIRSFDLATLYFTASTANGYLTVGRVNTGTANEYNLRINAPASATAAVPDFGKAVYGLEVTDSLGAVPLVVGGIARYVASVVS